MDDDDSELFRLIIATIFSMSILLIIIYVRLYSSFFNNIEYVFHIGLLLYGLLILAFLFMTRYKYISNLMKINPNITQRVPHQYHTDNRSFDNRDQSTTNISENNKFNLSKSDHHNNVTTKTINTTIQESVINRPKIESK